MPTDISATPPGKNAGEDASSCSRLERKAAAADLPRGRNEMQEVEYDYQELCRTLTLQVTPART